MCKDKKAFGVRDSTSSQKKCKHEKAMEKCICNASIVRNVTAIVTQATIDIKAA